MLGRLVETGHDEFRRVSVERWVSRPHSPTATSYGTFITRGGVEGFDNLAFGVGDLEAQYMDPQQRLLLEQSYASLHACSWRLTTLAGSDTGVFLGIERPDWVVAQPPAARA